MRCTHFVRPESVLHRHALDMDIKVNASRHAPWMTVRSNGREVWGPLRAPFALGAAVAGLVACPIGAIAGVAITIAAPAIARSEISVHFRGNDITGFGRRLATTYLIGLLMAIGGIVALPLMVAAVPLAPAISLVQSSVHGLQKHLRNNDVIAGTPLDQLPHRSTGRLPNVREGLAGYELAPQRIFPQPNVVHPVRRSLQGPERTL